MDQKMELPQGFSMQDAMRLAGTPAGQQLIRLLRQQNGTDLNAAMANAAKGNYDDARQALSSLLSSPEIQALLKQLGGMP